jgi:hypothetical protein
VCGIVDSSFGVTSVTTTGAVVSTTATEIVGTSTYVVDAPGGVLVVVGTSSVDLAGVLEVTVDFTNVISDS